MPLVSVVAFMLAQEARDYRPARDEIFKKGAVELGAYRMLEELCGTIGPRLSGSPSAAKAVAWAEKEMRKAGADRVFQVPCMVPRWVRGKVERARVTGPGGTFRLNACSLGMSVGTPRGGVTGEVVEVHSLAEAAELGESAKGKVVFFNRPFDLSLPTTFQMYGAAGDQRFAGPGIAGKAGAAGVLVRSLTSGLDDKPHTGTTRYGDNPPVPAMAIGPRSADRLSAALKKGRVKVKIEMSCRTLPDVPSASVVGEIRGSEKPDEVIVIGGHLDSWDKGTGAHDDGAGVVGSIEALRLLKALGLRPKRTIRAVAFMNEENGGRGAAAYAELAKSEKHLAAIESDSGGFMPRAFNTDSATAAKVSSWLPLLKPFGITEIGVGGGGADIGPLAQHGAKLFGFVPVDTRYFDYHHSDNDTIDKVNPRELEMGAMAMALLAYLLSEEGL